jgi:hypothetical protein
VSGELVLWVGWLPCLGDGAIDPSSYVIYIYNIITYYLCFKIFVLNSF